MLRDVTRQARGSMLALTVGVIAATLPLSSAFANTTRDMSRAVVKEVVRDTALSYPSRCFEGHRAASSPGWAYLTYSVPPPRGCPPGEGAWVVFKERSGEWREAGVTLLVIACRDLRVDLAAAKAPGTVFIDFRAAGVCQRGSLVTTVR